MSKAQHYREGKREGKVEGERKHNNSEIRVYGHLEKTNSRTKRYSTGFGGGGISPDSHAVSKLSSTPFYLVIHVEMGKNRDYSKCEWSR